MKRLTFFMALAAILFVLAACGDKQAKQSETADTPTAAAAAEKNASEEAADATDDDNLPDSFKKIPAIMAKWASKPLKNVLPDGTFDIERFASAFCNEYSEYEPNQAICEYLADPKAYEKKDTYFNIRNMKKNGYIACLAMLQCAWNTECCYWKRKNGHALVAFWLEQGHESETELEQGLLAFYDFNPDTNTMTPEPALSKMVTDAMAKYDSFSISLPSEGKDIELTGLMVNEEEDYCDTTPYLLRWNGNDFRLEEVKE